MTTTGTPGVAEAFGKFLARYIEHGLIGDEQMKTVGVTLKGIEGFETTGLCRRNGTNIAHVPLLSETVT